MDCLETWAFDCDKNAWKNLNATVPLDGASWLAVTVAAIAAVLPAVLFSEGGVRAGGNPR